MDLFGPSVVRWSVRVFGLWGGVGGELMMGLDGLESVFQKEVVPVTLLQECIADTRPSALPGSSKPQPAPAYKGRSVERENACHHGHFAPRQMMALGYAEDEILGAWNLARNAGSPSRPDSERTT